MAVRDDRREGHARGCIEVGTGVEDLAHGEAKFLVRKEVEVLVRIHALRPEAVLLEVGARRDEHHRRRGLRPAVTVDRRWCGGGVVRRDVGGSRDRRGSIRYGVAAARGWCAARGIRTSREVVLDLRSVGGGPGRKARREAMREEGARG